MSLNADFRLDDKYRHYFQRRIPNYIINEIDPVTRGLPNDQYKEGGLTVFDVGANQGLWAAALLVHSGPYIGEVHMFEPMPGNLKWIDQHLNDGIYSPYQSLIKVNDIAIGREPGNITMHYDDLSTPYASAAVETTFMGDRNIELSNILEVPVDTIDSYCERNGISKIDILKIDVEGLELDVLKGAESLLRKRLIHSIIYEFGTHQMGRKEYFKDFWDFLTSVGYTSHKVMTLGRAPQTIKKYSATFENFGGVGIFMATSQPSVAA